MTERIDPGRDVEAKAVGVIETDCFCPFCGYNLHGQVVRRDARLDISICQCPECGKFTPAGHTVGAERVWLARLSSGLTILWVLFLIYVIFMLVMGLGAPIYTHLDDIGRRLVSHSNELSEYDIRDYSQERIHTLMVAMISAAGVISLVGGFVLSVFLAHTRRWLYWVVLLPPVVGVCVYFIWQMDQPENPVSWGMKVVALYAMLEMVGLAVGVMIGRPCMRGVLRVLLSPRRIQQLAFLWYADGKSPPAAK